jgi:hypothetical protein
MKKLIILLAGLMLIGVTSEAQKIYIRGGLGVAVSTAASNNYDFNTADGSATTATAHKGGIGTGLPFVFAGGYKFNDHFGIELGIDYFYGFSLKSKSTASHYSQDLKWHGQMLSIVPAFVISIPLEKLKPYARVGLKLGVMNNVFHQEHMVITIEGRTEDTQSKSKDYGGIAIGAQAAVGTDFVLSDLFSLFGEIQLDGISYSPKHGKYTEYIKNGTDQLASLSVRDKEWNYLNEATFSNSGPPDQPDERVIRNFTFGNVGLVLGVKVNL